MVKREAQKSTSVNIWDGGSSQCRRGFTGVRAMVAFFILGC
jgi:hypothetical protein